MEITYNLERQDVISGRWYFYIVKPSVSIRKIRRFSFLFITTICLVQIFFTWTQHNWLYHILYLFISVGFYWLVFKCLTWLSTLYLVRQNIPDSGLVCQHTIILTESELIEKTNVNESHNSWEGIIKISENQDYLFIYITSEQAHIIPKRAFSDAEAYQVFYSFAKKCYEKYHPVAELDRYK